MAAFSVFDAAGRSGGFRAGGGSFGTQAHRARSDPARGPWLLICRSDDLRTSVFGGSASAARLRRLRFCLFYSFSTGFSSVFAGSVSDLSAFSAVLVCFYRRIDRGFDRWIGTLFLRLIGFSDAAALPGFSRFGRLAVTFGSIAGPWDSPAMVILASPAVLTGISAVSDLTSACLSIGKVLSFFFCSICLTGSKCFCFRSGWVSEVKVFSRS